MQIQELFRSAFTEADLVKADTVTCAAGEFVRLGEYVVKAGEAVSLGYGQQSGQENAIGRIFMDLKDTTSTPVAVDGLVRLTVYSPQDRPYKILYEYRTEVLRDNSTDRTKQIPFSENGIFVSEDKKIVLELKADTAKTLSKANTSILMDITQAVVA